MNSNTNKILMGIFVVLVFAVGFIVGNMTSGGGSFGTMVNTPATGGASTQEVATEGETATTINSSSLTDGQKKLLSSLGIDAESINVTQAMIVCAESSLGSARVEEIKNGATPSILEGAKLVACYK